MECRKVKNNFYIRFDKNESLLEGIKHICKQENIQAGYFHGIGACDYAVLGTYIPKKNDFIEHRISGMLEIVSFNGKCYYRP